jgi:hypothetical protein
MPVNIARLVDDLSKLSVTLFAASIAASSFLYSIAVQFERNGLASSQWISMIHIMILAGIIFMLSFGFGIISRMFELSEKRKRGTYGASLGFFIFGLMLLTSVSVTLWMNTI